MNSPLLIPIALYLVAVFALAFYSRRQGDRSGGFLNEYLLGNRSMGGFVLAMTLAATYASASSFIGGQVPRIQWGLAGCFWP